MYRAAVHKACTVYMSEPSPIMAITRRSGHAICAPRLAGRPSPREPAASPKYACSVWKGRYRSTIRAAVMASSTTVTLSSIISPRIR